MKRQFIATMTMVPLLLSGSHAAQPRTAEAWPSTETFSEDSGGYLGVDISDITSDRVAPLKLKEEKGVEVTMVDQDAPACKAGIKEHDVILTLNGAPVESRSQLHRMIRETPAGRTIALGVSRDGQPMTIKVQLGDRGKEFDYTVFKGKDGENGFHFEMPTVNLPEMDFPDLGVLYVRSSTRSGVMVESLTPQLSEFFGVKDGSGVLVRSVEKGSRADKAGLHAGDVIVKLDDRAVHDTDDFSQVMHSRHSGAIHVGVIRDKKEQNFTLTLPERKDSGKRIEESLGETQEMDAKTEAELSGLRNEIAKLRPQIETAREEAVMSAQQLTERTAELQKELGPQVQKEIEDNGRKWREEIQEQLEKLRQQMQTGSFDI